MDTYMLLREFADSWFLMLMFAFFVGVVIWAFRPGSAAIHEDSAEIPFRHEDRPAPDVRADTGASARHKEAR